MRGSKTVKTVVMHLFLFTIFFAVPYNPAFSDEVEARLTEDSITAFVSETNAMTNNGYGGKSLEQVTAFLDTHLHDDARFKSKMTYIIPGYPPKETKLSLDKKEFIDNIKSGEKALKDYKHDISVKQVKISSDGKKATVLTNGREEGIMAFQQGREAQDVPIIGASTCYQIIMLNDENVIQMYNANCNTEITFQDY